MTINLKKPDLTELKPRITVFGVGGAGGNAVNNMINSGLTGVEFVVANTDAQALHSSKADRVVQMGVAVTEGLGAGSQPEVGRAAAEEVIDEINDHLAGSHMVFITAGMGGGTGTGAAPVVARAAREHGILTVGVVTKPFQFEGQRRMIIADAGIKELQKAVDTLIVIPNQNLFRIANDRTTFADAFAMADQVLYSGVACITDLMVKEGLINLDFADVRSIMRGMGKAMMGTGEASGEGRAMQAAEAAIANPLLDEVSMRGSQGLLISITGGRDMTLFEVDEAATRIREEVDPEAMIILGATFDDSLEGLIRVSVVATGVDKETVSRPADGTAKVADFDERLRGLRAAAAAEADSAGTPAPTAGRPGDAQDDAGNAAAAADESAAGEPVPPPPYAQPPANPYAPPQGAQRPRQRMPRIEDFPPVAQRQYRSRQDTPREDHRLSPMALLRRLAQVGLGRDPAPPMDAPAPQRPRAGRQAPPPGYAPREPRPQQQRQSPYAPPAAQGAAPRAAEGQPQPAPISHAPQMPAPGPRLGSPDPMRKPQPRMPQDGGGYRPAQGQLDPHGRPTPQPRPAADEDHLEIPAFLRRQAN